MRISFLDFNVSLPPSLCFAINLASYQFSQSRAGVQSCMGRKSCRRGNVTQVFSHVTTPVCLWTRPSILPRTALQCLHLLLHPVILSAFSSSTYNVSTYKVSTMSQIVPGNVTFPLPPRHVTSSTAGQTLKR